MKRLKIGNETYEAEKVVKRKDSIVSYIDEKPVFSFNGISDFSGYTLVDECKNPVEFSMSEPTESQLIGQMITDMELAGIIQGQQATGLELRLIALEAKANV